MISQLNIFIRFTVFCCLLLIFQAAFQYLLISDTLYFNALQTQLSYERIEELLRQVQKGKWIGYGIVPILFIIKFTLIASCLSLGFYFAANQLIFKKILDLVIKAELVFLLPILLKMLWFLLIKTDYDLNDISHFYPLSILNIFDAETLPKYLLYPLQTLNLFEVTYWFLLAYGVADVTGFSFKRSFGLVMSSYGLGLVLWVVLVMFLTITYS